MRFGLSQDTIDKINSIFSKKSKIQRVILYGSRAKGNFKEGSDIDLTIEAPEFSIKDLLETENELEELFLPYKIDLSLKHQIENSELMDHINRVGVVFFSSSLKS